MLLAVVNDKTVATAGISAVGNKYKVRHRAEFGVDVIKEYWGLGIGKSIMKACVQCARNAGYKQLELEAVADNKKTINMYQSIGFVEFGRNPLGFISRYSGPQVVQKKLLQFCPIICHNFYIFHPKVLILHFRQTGK